MAINLNDTTPAAPAGTTNVAWQEDGSGNISANVPASAEQLTAQDVDLLAQAADVTSTTLFTTVNAGMYRISAYLVVTQAATSSSTLPPLALSWTDADNSATPSINATASDSGNLLTTVEQGTVVINAAAATNINFSTTGYASSGATPMQFSVHIRIEQLS